MQATDSPSWVRAPRQARSQETLDRFYTATMELLGERSFEEIAVTDIAKRAERTVGSFYARFEDKYAVLLELVEQSYEHVRQIATEFCDPERWQGRPLSDYVAEAVRMNIDGFRQRSPLYLAALCAATSDPRFHERRAELLRFCAERQKELLRTRADELGTSDPDRASDLMMELVVELLDARLVFGGLGSSSAATTEQLEEELVGVAAHVLGIEYPAGDEDTTATVPVAACA